MSDLPPLPATGPAPSRKPRPRMSYVFALVGGPSAWFIQLCLGDLMASGGCFRGSSRYLGEESSQSWTWPAMIVLLILCALVALGAFLVSLNRLRATRRGEATHFMALWGMLLGAGFCVATLLTVVAYIAVPRCA